MIGWIIFSKKFEKYSFMIFFLNNLKYGKEEIYYFVQHYGYNKSVKLFWYPTNNAKLNAHIQTVHTIKLQVLFNFDL